MPGSQSSFITNDTTTLGAEPLRRRRPRCLFYVVVTVSFIVNVALGVSVIYMHMLKPGSFLQGNSDAPSSQLGHGGHDVCFTCDQRGVLVESQHTYDIIRTTSHRLCCQRSTTDVVEAFKKIIIDELHRRIAGSDQLNSPPMLNVFTINAGSTGAHLGMVPGKGSKPVWTTHDDYGMSYCANVVCVNGTIRVLDAGRYLVYSHITFNVTRGHSDGIFTHRSE